MDVWKEERRYVSTACSSQPLLDSSGSLASEVTAPLQLQRKAPEAFPPPGQSAATLQGSPPTPLVQNGRRRNAPARVACLHVWSSTGSLASNVSCSSLLQINLPITQPASYDPPPSRLRDLTWPF